ncbi:MAG: CBS domain-containing protein [Candidatus Methanofastidiosia archaeon]
MPVKRRFLENEIKELKESLREEKDKTREVRFPSRMATKDIMQKCHEVDADMSIKELLLRLKDFQTTNFVVVDDNKKIIGIVTESDLMKIISKPLISTGIGGIGYKEAFLRTSEYVKDIMTYDPITISQDQTVEEVATLMRRFKISHVPVTEKDNKVVGIVSMKGILTVLRILS